MELLHTAHVPPGDGPLPTVLALHGWGANAHDLLGLAPLLHGGRLLMLCPQGPVRTPIGPGLDGYGWFPISTGGPPDPNAFAEGARGVAGFLDQALERYPIDRERLILLGFSQGGVMAYDLFLREPERFCALIALSSWLAEPLVRAAAPRDALATRPVLVVHGTRDPMIDVERARESRKLLLDLGVNLTYREYEMGHEIAHDALRDLCAWLDDKVLAPVQLA